MERRERSPRHHAELRQQSRISGPLASSQALSLKFSKRCLMGTRRGMKADQPNHREMSYRFERDREAAEIRLMMHGPTTSCACWTSRSSNTIAPLSRTAPACVPTSQQWFCSDFSYSLQQRTFPGSSNRTCASINRNAGIEQRPSSTGDVTTNRNFSGIDAGHGSISGAPEDTKHRAPDRPSPIGTVPPIV